ncbi:MAG: methylated-DNA--[protein]-cysteine S-methyltransferase [Oscillospiraceae bacterium]|jgi:methylated-DNA-[protein]-cysteine S-methyltransferase|nr:methylated-DNA--[protein]-cysteine S-methyltransferase [Oscillospiraceae bacterium]
MNIVTCKYRSPFGEMTAAARDDALVGLWFDGQKYYPKDAPTWEVASDYPVLRELRAWLDGYFGGDNPAITFELAPVGSEFRQAVWRILREIPYGGATTYGAIAKRVATERGVPRFSAQAVGGAVGHNPISILIPCHRVVGATGELTGYAGGLDKKRSLLDLERTTCAI